MEGESDLVIRKNSRMEGGCLNEQTNWWLKLESPSNQCEAEKAYIGGMTEMTLTTIALWLHTHKWACEGAFLKEPVFSIHFFFQRERAMRKGVFGLRMCKLHFNTLYSAFLRNIPLPVSTWEISYKKIITDNHLPTIPRCSPQHHLYTKQFIFEATGGRKELFEALCKY